MGLPTGNFNLNDCNLYVSPTASSTYDSAVVGDLSSTIPDHNTAVSTLIGASANIMPEVEAIPELMRDIAVEGYGFLGNTHMTPKRQQSPFVEYTLLAHYNPNNSIHTMLENDSQVWEQSGTYNYRLFSLVYTQSNTQQLALNFVAYCRNVKVSSEISSPIKMEYQLIQLNALFGRSKEST